MDIDVAQLSGRRTFTSAITITIAGIISALIVGAGRVDPVISIRHALIIGSGPINVDVRAPSIRDVEALVPGPSCSRDGYRSIAPCECYACGCGFTVAGCSSNSPSGCGGGNSYGCDTSRITCCILCVSKRLDCVLHIALGLAGWCCPLGSDGTIDAINTSLERRLQG